MDLLNRYAELLSPDAKLRLAIYGGADQRFQIVEERVQSYETGDEWNPRDVPFPTGMDWKAYWVIETRPREGLFGSVKDALDEAKRLLVNDG